MGTPMSEPGDVTGLLQRSANGDRQAEELLFSQVYDSLRRIAASHLRKERKDHTLQPTALINEAFVLLMRGADINFNSRDHFYAVAATQMRRILIDHARRRVAAKRPNALHRVELEKAQSFSMEDPDFLLALDQSLHRLAAESERAVKVVELHVFAGLTLEQVATALNRSSRTIKRDWDAAQRWLRRDLDSSRGMSATA
jgi:RNA polymerase sigma-70 factor (ECF subfamily)